MCNLNEICRYLLAGTINTIVGYCIFLIMLYVLNVNLYYSNIVGYIFGLIMAYILNKLFVFKSKITTKNSIYRFFIAFIFSFFINLFVLFIFVDILNQSPAISQIIAMTFYTIIFFLFNKFYVFKDNLNEDKF